ncbi:cytochrome P450 [Novosphingobium chloroacetimidivorans]|uniref:Cytochrome P450 n=1 Tax=Novosphingobium chloroacetimidivorans TaxID=1428314 RepID=A0A7W7NXF8_9SPHN|nr:cytochrome P450 [Novosphingobium chloroacetimidivorans]MBB4860618.1 cytochrome P450 [Novosphingobium chloroacetimidivorans]
MGQAITSSLMALLPMLFKVLRSVCPVFRIGNTYLVTRADDVRQVFADDRSFGVPYREKLNVITGGEPFILGLEDGCHYRDDLAALRQVMRISDVEALGAKVGDLATRTVDAAGGRIDVVDMTRRISFEFLAEYLGVPPVEHGDLSTWATRLFEYQFVSSDRELRDEVDVIAPALRSHVLRTIERRRDLPDGRDDVLGRCLVMQEAGHPRFDDAWICTALVGMIVGGPPQPAMVLPQAFEQLLRRSDALAGALRAARANDDCRLAAYIAEAMRFDPLAPWMPRCALATRTIGTGRHARTIPAGARVLASMASAMRDGRRVPDPGAFNPTRTPDQYLHFGFGVHQCFGLEINRATLHRMVKPLLQRRDLRRARGPAGRLTKQGAFASTLVVEFGA